MEGVLGETAGKLSSFLVCEEGLLLRLGARSKELQGISDAYSLGSLLTLSFGFGLEIVLIERGMHGYL